MIARATWIFLALLVSTALLAARPAVTEIDKFNWISDHFATGGQPTVAQIASLKHEGFRTIVNLREPSEYDAAAEEAAAKEHGLAYVNIPVKKDAPKAEQVDVFLKLVKEARVPANSRSGRFHTPEPPRGPRRREGRRHDSRDDDAPARHRAHRRRRVRGIRVVLPEARVGRAGEDEGTSCPVRRASLRARRDSLWQARRRDPAVRTGQSHRPHRDELAQASPPTQRRKLGNRQLQGRNPLALPRAPGQVTGTADPADASRLLVTSVKRPRKFRPPPAN